MPNLEGPVARYASHHLCQQASIKQYPPFLPPTEAFIVLRPGKPSSKRLGSFLVQCQFQGSVNSSAMFLTAAAQNLLCLKLATELGVAIPSPWLTWFKAAFVPAFVGVMVTPLILYKVSRCSLYIMLPCGKSTVYWAPTVPLAAHLVKYDVWLNLVQYLAITRHCQIMDELLQLCASIRL